MQKKIHALTFVILIAIDQISKYIIRHTGGFYICNKGIAFGLSPLYFFIFLIFILLIILAITKIFNLQLSIFNQFSISKFSNKLFISLILAGGISNIMDRLYFGCVIDFIDLRVWPVFNFADIYITIGSIILLVNLFKKGTK